MSASADATPRTSYGVFGGSFDPLHVGHLIAASDAFEALSLDRLAFVPARRSPLKRELPAAPAALRFRMLEACIETDDRFELWDIEIERAGPSYTVDTLREIRAGRPELRLVLILGVDQWAQFGEWRDPGEILSMAEVALVTRLGEHAEAPDPSVLGGGGVAIHEVPVTRIDISASLVRARVREGRSIRYLVPDAVRRIIEDNNLYL